MVTSKLPPKQKAKLQAIITRNVRESEKDVDLLVGSIKEYFNRSLKRIIKGLKVDDLTAKERAKALGDLESAMKEAGIQEQLAGINDLFSGELGRVKELYKEATGKRALLGKVGKEDLQALTSFTFEDSSVLLDSYIGDVRTPIIQGALGDSQLDIADVIDSASDKIAANLTTEWNTSVSGYSRLAGKIAAEEVGISRFIYLGPLDEVTRPFCEPLVGNVYSAEDIAGMDNGQVGPVSVYGGGYNCRHQWLPYEEGITNGG